LGISASIRPDTIRNYKRLNYEIWYALAEFVDNSTQSYFSNRQELEAVLDEAREEFFVRIVHDKDAGLLRISDNAFGMTYEVLERALVHGNIPADTTGRNEFGMGLKTAACWFGNRWTVRTTALGDTHEYQIEYDVERVASGDLDLRESERTVSASAHYTVIEIFDLNRSFGGRAIGKAKEYLRSMYRVDTRSGALHLYWGDDLLTYEDGLEFLTAADGSVFRKDFQFEVNGKSVSGWGGILEAGGRPKAGFAIIRRGRVIQGQPSAWRPHGLFGLQEMGSNNLVNQRLVGEIHLDNFLASQQKDAIQWMGDEEPDIERLLEETFSEYRQTAANRRKNGGEGPSAIATAAALDNVASAIGSASFIDDYVLTEVPSSEVVAHSTQHVLDRVRARPGDKEITVGQSRIKIFLENDLSVNDPYYASERPGDDLIVVINTNHPFFANNLAGQDSVVAYLVHCVYDALAEKKCADRIGEIQPDTVKLIKDLFLREPLSE
jgi:hypothetical protein